MRISGAPRSRNLDKNSRLSVRRRGRCSADHQFGGYFEGSGNGGTGLVLLLRQHSHGHGGQLCQRLPDRGERRRRQRGLRNIVKAHNAQVLGNLERALAGRVHHAQGLQIAARENGGGRLGQVQQFPAQPHSRRDAENAVLHKLRQDGQPGLMKRGCVGGIAGTPVPGAVLAAGDDADPAMALASRWLTAARAPENDAGLTLGIASPSVPSGSMATAGIFSVRSVETRRESFRGASSSTPSNLLTEGSRNFRQRSAVACSARAKATA